MHYIILRDDDTNALTPPECLEQLYRPFLDRGLPVNLAVIPNVRTDATTLDGQLEGFLLAKNGDVPQTAPIGTNEKLVRYLLDNPGYHIMQHGYHHEPAEFDRSERDEIARRLRQGARLLKDAGFPMPETFVAPHDKLSRAAYEEIAQRYRVISTGWFELRRLPLTWWPRYVLKKCLHRTHWRIGQTLLLSHPGCLLSCHRPYDQMFETVRKTVESRPLTVLVTHWWEYFRGGVLDEKFQQVLHQVAEYLASDPDFTVISCDALSDRRNGVAWN